MKCYYFSKSNKTSKDGIASALKEIFKGRLPIVCCIGTDAVSGDSLGPLVGTMLTNKLLGKTYIYGTLDKPITAKDISAISAYFKAVHGEAEVLAVDAALGAKDETGFIKVGDYPIKPGLGMEKDLSEIGNASIIAVVEEKPNKNLLSAVRISTVYSLAAIISGGIKEYFDEAAENSAAITKRAFRL